MTRQELSDYIKKQDEAFAAKPDPSFYFDLCPDLEEFDPDLVNSNIDDYTGPAPF